MIRDERRPFHDRTAGFTLVEVSIIVMVLAVLSAILLPQLGVYLRDARMARAREDVAAIGVAMFQMLKDTGESRFFDNGQGNNDTPDRRGQHDHVAMLIGDGDTPDRGVDGTTEWRKPLGHFIQVGGTGFPVEVSGVVDTFANHLIQNNPAEEDGNYAGEPYRTPADMIDGGESSAIDGGLRFDPAGGQAFNSEFAWRGPYLDAVRPDPWGNRYMANVLWLMLPQLEGTDSAGLNRPVVVFSAGPDEEVDTAFGMVGGLHVGDDDVVYPVSYGTLR